MENQIPNCEVCGQPKNFIKAGVAKSGKPYPAFWGCPNRCKVQPAQFNNGKVNMSAIDPIKILSDEIISLREEFRKTSRYLVMKLETPEEKKTRLANEPVNVSELNFNG